MLYVKHFVRLLQIPKKKTISAAADHTIAVVNVQFPDRTEDIL